MFTSFLTSFVPVLIAHSEFIFWTGIGVEVIGQLWLHLSSYEHEVPHAQWALLFPPFALYLAVRHPEACARAVVICLFGVALIWAGVYYTPTPEELRHNASQVYTD